MAAGDRGTKKPGWAAGRWGLALALQAPFLGGATEGWSRGISVFLIGAMLVWRPPERTLGRWTNLLLLALLLWAALPLLPARWLGAEQPGWRVELADYARDLPTTLSVQPWLTAEGCLLFAAGIAALYWFATLRFSAETRQQLVRLFAGGIVVFGAACLLLHALGIEPPFWHNARHFGPFPSRNHTGNVLGVGAVVAGICAMEGLRRRHASGWWFLAGLAVLIAALVANLSRGGMVVLFAGALIYAVYLVRRREWKLGVLLLAAMIAGGVMLLLFSGGFSERLGGKVSGLGFRGLIYQDTWRMVADHPWFGVSFGNFETVFPVYRDASANPAVRVVHPESDWWWVAASLGAVGCGLMLAACWTLVPRVSAVVRREANGLEVAAAAAVAGFMVHGLIDVPGHLFGTALPALWLLGVVVGAGRLEPGAAWGSWGWRAVGCLLAAGGIYLFAADRRPEGLWPGSSGAAQALRQARGEIERGRYKEALSANSEGLRSAPLSWRLRFQRAVALLGLGRFEEAMASFKCAKLLQPGRAELPEKEAEHWLAYRPELAAPAWREALALEPAEAPRRFEQMLAAAGPRAGLQVALRGMALERPELLVVYVRRSEPAAAAAALEQWRRADPNLEKLSLKELAVVLRAWMRYDAAHLAPLIEQSPRWLAAAWPLLAERLAGKGEFQQAYQLGRRLMAAPKLPEPIALGEQELRQRVSRAPGDFMSAFALAALEEKAGRLEMAAFIAGRAAETSGAPPYLHFRKAELCAAHGDWEAAWKALAAYQTRLP